MNLTLHVRRFIEQHGLLGSELLLALSGGADSMALFHCLIKNRIRFQAAHVDHGWRPESGEEARTLKELCDGHGIPFHLKKLDPAECVGNLEEASREARYAFFFELLTKTQAAGVLLAHHADDQAETVLKRVLEGAGLSALKGMLPAAVRDGVLLLRPFLDVKKETLKGWLAEQGSDWFEDPTNSDPRYLRSRLRAEILPWLSERFGKDPAKPLCHLGTRMAEMDDYIDKELAALGLSWIEGWAGSAVDLRAIAGLHPFMIKQLIAKLFDQRDSRPSTSQLDEVARDLADCAAAKSYSWMGRHLHIDREIAFLTRKLDEEMAETPLVPGQKTVWGGWSVELSDQGNAPLRQGWRAVWQGRAEILLPPGEYLLKAGEPHALYLPQKKELGRWWTENRVPAFLRRQAPCVWNRDGVAAEFFGRQPIPKEGWQRLRISRRF